MKKIVSVLVLTLFSTLGFADLVHGVPHVVKSVPKAAGRAFVHEGKDVSHAGVYLSKGVVHAVLHEASDLHVYRK